jgi:hypothetical protein
MIFDRGTTMRVIALLCCSARFSDVAIAQTSQCQSVSEASDRLACYDKAAPPTAVSKPALSKTPTATDKPAASKTPTDGQGTVIDVLAVENSKLDAKIKSICRGC